MSNIIKIGTFSITQPDGHGKTFSKLVDQMINHLRLKMEPVLAEQPDIILFPECCDKYGDFTAEQWLEYIDVRGEKILDFLGAVAQKHKCYIGYPTVRKDADGFLRNSLLLIGRNGSLVGTYNKACPPINELENWHITPGSGAKIIELDFGRIAPVVCFDLNFKWLRDDYISLKPDLILFPSMFHGAFMPLTWAYECQAYFVGAIHRHESRIISPIGKTLTATTNYHDSVVTEINLDYALVHLDYNREKIQNAKIKYGSDFQVSDPGYLSSVLLSNFKTDLSIKNIVKEYGIETLDEYLSRSYKMIESKINQNI